MINFTKKYSEDGIKEKVNVYLFKCLNYILGVLCYLRRRIWYKNRVQEFATMTKRDKIHWMMIKERLLRRIILYFHESYFQEYI